MARWIGVNPNQAVARLHALDEPGPDLQLAAAHCMQVARRLTRPPWPSSGAWYFRVARVAGRLATDWP